MLAEATDLVGYDIGGLNGPMVTAGTPQSPTERLPTEVEKRLETAKLRNCLDTLGVAAAVG